MQRETERLASDDFDIVVIGGGILGAYLAFEASRRGHRVALVERADFGSGTTAGSGKVLHGGLRYLQHLAFGLAVESSREQQRIARLAPRLVRPLPFVVSADRGDLRERLLLCGGAWTWKALRTLAGTGGDLPATRYLDSEGTRRTLGPDWGRDAVPALEFCDYQLRSPERLTTALVSRAAELGAVAVNYAEAQLSGAMQRSELTSIAVQDRLTDRALSVSGRVFVNGTGAWSRPFLSASGDGAPGMRLARGVHAVFDVAPPPASLAVRLEGEDAGSTLGRERRMFVMPWENRTLVGATYTPHRESPGEARPLAADVELLASALRRRAPDGADPSFRALYAYAGLYPIFDGGDPEEGTFEASLRPRLVDHARTGGPSDLVTATSVKLTSAGALAERTLDLAEEKLGRSRSCPDRLEPLPRATPTPLAGEEGLRADRPWNASFMEKLLDEAVANEMAVRLSDFLFRRTWLGHLGRPEEEHLRWLGRRMAARLGWDDRLLELELASVAERYEAVEAFNERSGQTAVGSAGRERPAPDGSRNLG